MPKYRVTGPDGGTYEVNAPDGATEQDAIAYVQGQQTKKVDMPSPGASSLKGSAAGGAFMGLRDAVDAGAQLLRRAVPDSVGNAIDAAGNYLADAGLPVARSTGVQGVDSIVKGANREYEDSRKLAGRDGIDLARIAGNVANPVNRIVPMAGAGTAAGVAGRAAAQGAISGLATPVLSDDFGTSKAAQVGLGAATGAAGGYAADKAIGAIGKGVDAAKRVMQSGAKKSAAVAQAADDALARAAAAQDVDLSIIPEGILRNAREQVGRALRRNETIDPQAVLRAAEGRTILGDEAALTLGQATRDPMLYAREANLRGVDGAGNALADRFAAQNRALINSLNTRGATAAPGEMSAGQQLGDALRGYDAGLRNSIGELYANARALNANDIPLDHRAFADTALETLDREMKTGFLPTQIQNIVNGVSEGRIPLNISTGEQIKSTLAEATRAANRAGDGNTVRALGIVRDALESAQPPAGYQFGGSQIVPAGAALPPASAGAEAQAAFNAARSAARDRFGQLESNPALRAAVDDMAPDKFFQRHVLGSTARDFQSMLNVIPEQTNMVRTQVLDFLKSKALGGASDEVGKFSQSGYNKALRQIGDTKLLALFEPSEVAALRSVGRVAANIQAQPAGAAVNNSNTASAVMNLLGQMNGRVGSLPGVNLARDSVRKFLDERAAAAALGGEIPTQAAEAVVNPLRARLLPYAGSGGLLGAYMGQ